MRAPRASPFVGPGNSPKSDSPEVPSRSPSFLPMERPRRGESHFGATVSDGRRSESKYRESSQSSMTQMGRGASPVTLVIGPGGVITSGGRMSEGESPDTTCIITVDSYALVATGLTLGVWASWSVGFVVRSCRNSHCSCRNSHYGIRVGNS